MGRLGAQHRDRPHPRHVAERGRVDQARALLYRHRGGSGGLHRRAARDRSGGGAAAAADVRTGARLLAPVLPEPARIAGHRRDRPDRRHRAPARHRRRARAPDRRPGPGRRPAAPRQGLEEGARARPGRLARRRDRPRDRGLMRAVNLLPRDEAKRSFEARRGVVFGGVAGAALATAVLASMTMSAGGSVSGKQEELDALRAQVADTSKEDAFAAEKGARVGALSAALSGRVAWDRVLRQVSLVLPEDVWLTNLTAAAPDAAQQSATGSGFTLTGATYSQNGVARFLARLAVIPDLANVRLQSSQSQLLNERELVQFTILADVRPPGSVPAAPAAAPADATVPSA